jgi:hypothetical protein
MSSLPENINYGNPNAHPASFQFYSNEKTESKDDIESNNDKKDDKNSDLNQRIMNFLNLKATSILTFAIAVAIGFGIKDFINAAVMNVLQPILFSIVLALDKNDYLPITASLREKNVQIDISKFMGSLLVLKLVVGFTYFMYVYTNILSPLKFI